MSKVNSRTNCVKTRYTLEVHASRFSSICAPIHRRAYSPTIFFTFSSFRHALNTPILLRFREKWLLGHPAEVGKSISPAGNFFLEWNRDIEQKESWLQAHVVCFLLLCLMGCSLSYCSTFRHLLVLRHNSAKLRYHVVIPMSSLQAMMPEIYTESIISPAYPLRLIFSAQNPILQIPIPIFLIPKLCTTQQWQHQTPSPSPTYPGPGASTATSQTPQSHSSSSRGLAAPSERSSHSPPSRSRSVSTPARTTTRTSTSRSP